MSHVVWLEQADNDLKAASALSAVGHHSQAVWLAGQAVEKAHKAIIAAMGLQYEERHFKHLGHGTGEISRMLPDALHQPHDPQIAVMVNTLETRALASRYPAWIICSRGTARISPTRQCAPRSKVSVVLLGSNHQSFAHRWNCYRSDVMRFSDPIVEEVRAVREAFAKEFDYDIDRMAQAIKEREAKSGRPLVRLSPKRIPPTKKAS